MEKLDDLVEKLLKDEMLKNKILENLENNKSNKDWSLIDFPFEIKEIDLSGMETGNVVLHKFMWNDLAKLNIDLLLDFDYYKQFQFKSRYDLPIYKTMLRLMGYKYSHKLWISYNSPDRLIAVKSVLYSKLFDEVYKEKLSSTENKEFLNEWNIENYFNSVCLKSRGKSVNKCDKICKICESLNENFETICSFCEYQFSSDDEEVLTVSENFQEFCRDDDKENEINEKPQESQISNLDNIDYSSLFPPNENNNPSEDLPLNDSQFTESLNDDNGCVAADCQLTNRNLEIINNAHWQCTHCTFINDNTIDNCWECQFINPSKFPITSTVLPENIFLKIMKIIFRKLWSGFCILFKISCFLILLAIIVGLLELIKR